MCPRCRASSAIQARTQTRRPEAEDGRPIGLIEIPQARSVVRGARGRRCGRTVVRASATCRTPRCPGTVATPCSLRIGTRSSVRSRTFVSNDVIKFSTADAEFEYVVKELKVVEPTAVEVLEPTSAATLTLITCFPFDYIGPAPQRFIVRAERRSSSPLEPEA